MRVAVGVAVLVGVEVSVGVRVPITPGVAVDVVITGCVFLGVEEGVAVSLDAVADGSVVLEGGWVGVKVGCTKGGGGVFVGRKGGKTCSIGVMVGIGAASTAVTVAILDSISAVRG